MENTPKKNLIELEGFITGLTEPIVIRLPDGNKFTHSVATFETEDGQKAYFEIRKKIIEQIQASDLIPSVKVKIGFVMLGAVKKDKLFNKLFINKLEIAE